MAARFKQRILHGYLVRFQMSLILTAVVASGVLSSKLLLMAGFHSLRLRYPIAVLVSYGVFLGLVRVWLWYVSIRTGAGRRDAGISLGSFDGAMDLAGAGRVEGAAEVRFDSAVGIQAGPGLEATLGVTPRRRHVCGSA